MNNKKDESNLTKMHIVDTAIDLFRQRGYYNVSVTDICKASKISRSTFYYYFKSKDEIFDSFLLKPELIIFDKLPSILINSSSYIEQFYQIFETFLKEMMETGPEIFGQVLKRNIDNGDLKILVPYQITMWDIYINLIKKAQEAGEINNPNPPEEIVEAITYITVGISVIWCNKNGSFDLIAKNRQILEALLLVKDELKAKLN
ncbi:MAG TPA: TetR/AcrR family transcriptional regulator [Thermoanaerobacterales bacterium]|nr:TetR/AcrR family transcriptional regulator [Thermoanaerobacterales bacterium]